MILSFALFFLNSKGCVPLSSLWSAIAPEERGPHAGVAVAAEGFPLMADLNTGQLQVILCFQLRIQMIRSCHERVGRRQYVGYKSMDLGDSPDVSQHYVDDKEIWHQHHSLCIFL